MPTNDDEIMSLEDDIEEETDTDRTIIQGVSDLTAKLEGRQASLMVISGSSVGKMFRIDQDAMTIGRAPECGICLPEDGISREHARVDQDEYGNVFIEDLNSTNGTYFDGAAISRHLLRDGDKIQIGSTTILKFSYQDSLEEEFYQNQYDQATRDPLTQIFNKRSFFEKINESFSYALRHAEPTSLIMFDLDHFKKINDTFGHQCGDMVLKEVADVVSSTLRGEDVFARYGGEEFAVIMRNQNAQRAYVAAERIRRSIEKHRFLWEHQRIPVTISLGVATLSKANFMDPAEMIKEADHYLYKAKGDGRNRTSSSVRE